MGIANYVVNGPLTVVHAVASANLAVEGMTNYLGWERVGVISALGCEDLEAMEKTSYPQEAYELGKSL